MRRSSTALILIVAIASLIMFYNLGSIPLLDPDEPVYAETPKEMYAFQEFISPRIYGEYWYDKPPMYYWLVAVAYKIFGINEFSARFPSALLGVVCVIAVYYFSRRIFDSVSVALPSALVLATSIEYWYLGKAAVTDITLNLFLTLSLLCFITKKYYWFYLWAGIATLTKGPIGLLFPGAIVFLYLLTTSRWAELKDMKIPAGILIYVFVGVPWYVIMYKIHGNIFIDTFLGFHNITRFTSPEHPEGVLWYYYIPVLILGFFPWTALAMQAVWNSLTKGSSERNTLIFLNIWAAFIFIFFTISRTKLISYILPMFPPLAMITGWYFNYLLSNQKRCVSWGLTTIIVSTLLIAGMVIGLKSMPDLKFGVTVASAVLGVMALTACYFVWQKHFRTAFWIKVIAMTIFSLVMMTLLLPVAAPHFASLDIAKQFTAQYDGKSQVYIIKFLRPGFAFYTEVYGQQLLNNAEFKAAVSRAERAYFIVRESEYKSLSDTERQEITVLAKEKDKMLLLKQ